MTLKTKSLNKRIDLRKQIQAKIFSKRKGKLFELQIRKIVFYLKYKQN